MSLSLRGNKLSFMDQYSINSLISRISYHRTASQDMESDGDDMNDHYLSDIDIGDPSDIEYDSSFGGASGYNTPSGYATPQFRPQVGHHRVETSMDTKLARIREGIAEQQRKKKKKVKDISSFCDLWRWYWQHPIAHFPFIYYFIIFLSTFIFIVYWFMDQESCFIFVGIIGLTMSSYSFYKFKISIALKQEIDKYKTLNLNFKKENIKLQANVDRAEKAINLLKSTQKRLSRANHRNQRNLHKFENVEENMRVIGKKANLKLTDVRAHTHEIREKWRNEFLSNERHLLHAVFNRYERKHSSHQSKFGMTHEDFLEFQQMLPERYSSRFDRLGTFHKLSAGKSMIDVQDFANTLDVFAKMEVDEVDVDIQMTPKSTHMPNVSSFTISLDEIDLDALSLSPKKKPKQKPKQIGFTNMEL